MSTSQLTNSKMAESNNGADHAFKVAVESILQRKIKEITNEEEVIYEE